MHSFISYVDGPLHAPAVVLLHSLATHADLWLPQLPVWRRHFRVVRIDLPGHGASAPLADTPTLAAFADGVAAVLDENGIHDAALVGISLGSMVAQSFALRYPERTRALVLAHAGARTPDIAKGIWNQRIVQCRRDGIDSQVDATLGRWFTPDFLRTSPLTMEWVADMIRSTHPDGYVGAIAAIQKLDHVEALARVACPTLVIAGAHDGAVPPEAALALCTAIPNARYELLRQVAHIGNVEQPALFTELAGGFLQRELQ